MAGSSLELSLAALKNDCAELSESGELSDNGDQDTVRPKTCSRWMGFVHKDDTALMGVEERISLQAMIAYVAHTTGHPEFKIERELSDRFGVPNVHCLTADKYERAIALLSDQVAAVA